MSTTPDRIGPVALQEYDRLRSLGVSEFSSRAAAILFSARCNRVTRTVAREALAAALRVRRRGDPIL